jgi:DNA-binding LacI/PurR family transcriptional regulator
MPSGLTTVRQDAVLMAEHAVRLEKPEPREAVLDPEPVIRGTSGPAPQGWGGPVPLSPARR